MDVLASSLNTPHPTSNVLPAFFLSGMDLITAYQEHTNHPPPSCQKQCNKLCVLGGAHNLETRGQNAEFLVSIHLIFHRKPLGLCQDSQVSCLHLPESSWSQGRETEASPRMGVEQTWLFVSEAPGDLTIGFSAAAILFFPSDGFMKANTEHTEPTVCHSISI